MYRGSEWGRWDLHVHTKGTAKNDQFGDITFEDFCVELFKKALEKEIKVIGITDYFNVENYKKVKQFQKEVHTNQSFSDIEKDRIDKIFLIPNIELRITPSTDKGGLINLHLLLDPDHCAIYESQFARLLKFTYSDTKTYSLDRNDLIRLGKDVDNNYLLDDGVALKKGVSNFILNPSDIINAFKEMPTFKDSCIITVANSNKDGNSSYQGHERFFQQSENATLSKLRESIYKLSDVIFSSNPKDIDFFLGKESEDKDEFLKKLGSFKPCIHGSDAHNFDKLFEPDKQRYCWIKSEPSFEGLKQILHEPETRVYIGLNRPEPKTDYEVIDRIKISHENIATKVLYLNPNLNTIIGGRSSGKSTLVKCIANKVAPNALENGEPENHIKEISDHIRIFWQDGNEDDTRSIDYFYQGHMFYKTHEEGIESIVKDILFQLNPKTYEDSDKKIAGLRQQNSSQLSNYFSNQELINQKLEQSNNIGNKTDVLQQIDRLDQLINRYSVGSYTQEELEKHSSKQDTLKELERHLTTLESTIEDMDNLCAKVVLEISNPFLDNPFYQYIKDTIEEKLTNIETFAENQVEELKQGAKLALDTQNDYYVKKISLINADSKFNQIEQYLKATESIKPLIIQKSFENQKLENILQLEGEISGISNESSIILTNARANWKLINKEPLLLTKEIEVLEDNSLEISPTPKFQSDKFSEFIVKYINQQPEKAQNIANSQFFDVEGLLSGFDEISEALNSRLIKLKSGFTEENFYSEFLTTTWFKLSYDVLYEGDSYTEMSQGKKAFVVLKLSLDCSERKCPIIIDQPEDDLDNRAIYTELVKYIKDKKSQRQIILVTHNANVVVNADSEQIIVANQHGSKTPNKSNKKFEYKSGSIESSVKSKFEDSILESKTIKEHICEILEGGDIAFKLREKKYNF
ncbi:TrlF family AAA-like ATPase [Psychrobacter sp. AT9]|uniref:TrlF family AAA-like ATPase n=1 Tax=Psychrobacter TaxID=497 RepID=UPI0039A5F07D